MAKLKTLNLSDEVVQEIEKEQNHSKRADELIRKGLLYEQGSNGSLEGLVAVIQQACIGLLNIEHVCICKQEAKEVKKPTPKTTKKETVEPIKEVKTEWDICKDMEKDFYYICNDTEVYTDDNGDNIHFETREEAEEFLKQIKEETKEEVQEEETFNVDIPDTYKSGNFRGKLVDSYKDMDGNVVTKGGDILHLCTVNDEAIIVYKVDEHKVAYYFDEFEDAYKGEEVYASKPNQYNFLKEWGLVD